MTLEILFWAPLQTVLGTGPVPWRFYALAWLGVPLIFVLDLVRKKISASHSGELSGKGIPRERPQGFPTDG
ncbi:MAG: hypothetical protein ACYC9Y_02025 [Candidatus Methylomirabilia bacterium]